MYNQPYFIPGYFQNMAPSMMRNSILPFSNSAMNTIRGASKGMGLFNKLGNGMQFFKNINWSGLITNTSKTLNVVNQAIPLVRQVGPMVNNMKSMLRVASLFKDETDKKTSNKSNNKQNNITANNSSNNLNQSNTKKSENSNIEVYDNSPTFFIET